MNKLIRAAVRVAFVQAHLDMILQREQSGTISPWSALYQLRWVVAGFKDDESSDR
jgi:hypothetical protein